MMGFEATTLANVGLIGQGVGAVAGAYGATRSARGAQVAAGYQAQVAENNRQLAEWQAQDALKRGQVDVARAGLRTRQLAGTQRASMASRGIDLGEGSALNILSDTDYMGAIDSMTLTNNAEKEAYGYRVAATNASNNADLYRFSERNQSPMFAGMGTLLTGAGSVASKWYDLKAKGAV